MRRRSALIAGARRQAARRIRNPQLREQMLLGLDGIEVGMMAGEDSALRKISAARIAFADRASVLWREIAGDDPEVAGGCESCQREAFAEALEFALNRDRYQALAEMARRFVLEGTIPPDEQADSPEEE